MIENFASGQTIAIVPIIVAIVQLFKMVGNEKINKFAPFISIAAGILISFIANDGMDDIGDAILGGIIYGLSASGLYSGVKTSAHSMKNDESEEI